MTRPVVGGGGEKGTTDGDTASSVGHDGDAEASSLDDPADVELLDPGGRLLCLGVGGAAMSWVCAAPTLRCPAPRRVGGASEAPLNGNN